MYVTCVYHSGSEMKDFVAANRNHNYLTLLLLLLIITLNWLQHQWGCLTLTRTWLQNTSEPDDASVGEVYYTSVDRNAKLSMSRHNTNKENYFAVVETAKKLGAWSLCKTAAKINWQSKLDNIGMSDVRVLQRGHEKRLQCCTHRWRRQRVTMKGESTTRCSTSPESTLLAQVACRPSNQQRLPRRSQRGHGSDSAASIKLSHCFTKSVSLSLLLLLQPSRMSS